MIVRRLKQAKRSRKISEISNNISKLTGMMLQFEIVGLIAVGIWFILRCFKVV